MNSKSASNRGPPDIALDDSSAFDVGAANTWRVGDWLATGLATTEVEGMTFANFKSPFVEGTVRKRSRNAISNVDSQWPK